MQIKFETHDPVFIAGFSSNDRLIEPYEGIKIHIDRIEARLAVDLPMIIEWTVQLAVPVSTALFADWLYDKFRGRRATQISINRREIDFDDEGNIKRILEETIDQER